MIDQHLVDTLHDIFEEYYKQCEVGEEIAKALKLAGYKLSQEPQPYCITEINRDGSITYKRIQPQSVSTPTEGMELSEDKIREYIKRITINHYYFIYPAGNWETKDDTEKIQWEMETEYWVKPILLEIRDNIARAQFRPLPTEQGAELNNKLREQFATLIWHYWEQHFAYPKSAHLYGCVDELFKLLKSLPTKQGIRESERKKIAKYLGSLCVNSNHGTTKIPKWDCVNCMNELRHKLSLGQSPKEV